MIGSLFAGTDESPGDLVLYQGRSYKVYRGMGSLGAMKQRQPRTATARAAPPTRSSCPKASRAASPTAARSPRSSTSSSGGLRSGMGYTGCKHIHELRTKARFVRITSQGLRESHVHDVIITEEAPNYFRS